MEATAPIIFSPMTPRTRRSKAKRAKKLSSEELQAFMNETQEKVIQILLKNIKPNQLESLNWPGDGQNYIDAIMVGSQVGDPTDMQYKYKTVTYTFSEKSTMPKERFSMWIRNANGPQFEAILKTIRCFDQVAWAFQEMTPEQQTYCKTVSLSEHILIEMCKYRPELFFEYLDVCIPPPSTIYECFYFLPTAARTKALTVYITIAPEESLRDLARQFASQTEDSVCKGIKARVEYVKLYDEICYLLRQQENKLVNELLYNFPLLFTFPDRSDEGFIRELVQYISTLPTGHRSDYWECFFSDVSRQRNLWLSMLGVSLPKSPHAKEMFPHNNDLSSAVSAKTILDRIYKIIPKDDLLKLLIPHCFSEGTLVQDNAFNFIKRFLSDDEDPLVQALSEDLRKHITPETLSELSKNTSYIDLTDPFLRGRAELMEALSSPLTITDVAKTVNYLKNKVVGVLQKG